MPRLGCNRVRWFLVCLALAFPLTAAAQSAGTTPDPAFTFNPPPCQGNVFLDVNCSVVYQHVLPARRELPVRTFSVWPTPRCA
jgi:hypothetical protein